MPRILIITYYFPPWGLGGVQRVAKFAKYLPDFGWDVTVIAPSATDYHQQDPTLLDDLPRSVRVERIEYSDIAMSLSRAASHIGRIGPIGPISRWLSSWRDFPDRHRQFAVLAVKRARELMKESPFDIVFTSSPPPSVHLAGLELKRDIPWIADFRDPWQALADDYGPTLFHRLRNSALHQRILKSADAVVAVTPELRKHFESDCGGDGVQVIRNGYDEADFAGTRTNNTPSAELRIVLPGTFSRSCDPRPLLQALVAYRSRIGSRRLRITHVGASMGCDLPRLVADAGLNDVFHDLGYVGHRAAIRTMLNADLLMLSYTDRRGTDAGVPGRVYEMLRTLRPIIALTPSPGALANLLSPIAGCDIFSPEDSVGVAGAIEKHAPATRKAASSDTATCASSCASTVENAVSSPAHHAARRPAKRSAAAAASAAAPHPSSTFKRSAGRIIAEPGRTAWNGARTYA